MRLRGFDTTRSQLGWVCDCCFLFETTNQSTAEEHVVREGGKWMWLAMLRSWRSARKYAALHAAKPGEREKLGWS